MPATSQSLVAVRDMGTDSTLYGRGARATAGDLAVSPGRFRKERDDGFNY
jgi:hypothetical protein